MKNPPENISFIEFKEDILKKFHIFENNLKSEYASKFIKINSNFEQIELKINTIFHNNNSLLDSISKQNINLEKLNKLETLGTKADQTLLTQEIQLKHVSEEISTIKKDLYKVISENLTIPGRVGPGAVFKNLTEYLVYQMDEINKLRNMISHNKNKFDDWEKTALNIITNALFKFQTQFNNKHKQINVLIEKNKGILNNKILDLETNIEKYQNKIDKLVKQMENDIQNEIQKVSKEKAQNIEEFEKKFNEFNLKLNSITPNFNKSKKIRFKSNLKNKENNITPYFKKPNEDLINIDKNIFKSSKNLFSFDLDINTQRKGVNKELKFDEEKNNNSFIIKDIKNDFSQIYSSRNSPKRKNSFNQFINNESKNNKEENNLPILSERQSKNHSNKEENNFPILSERKSKINSFRKDNNLQNLKLIKNNSDINSNDNFQTLNKLNILVQGNKTTEKNIININKNININQLTANNGPNTDKGNDTKNKNIINISQETLNNSSLTERKKKANNNTKQKSESKQFNTIGRNHDLSIINNYFNEEEKYSTVVNKVNYPNNKSKESIGIQNNFTSRSSESNPKKKKENINIKTNNNNNNINSKNSISKNKDNNNILCIKKKTINMQMNTNINTDQQKINSKIREYYNNKKMESTKKSNQKLIECNLINMNFRNSCENILPKNISYSYKKSVFNTLNEPKIKIEQSYRNTNYKFYTKRNNHINIRSINKEK